MTQITVIDWDTILPIWRDYLWKGRLTAIKPTNGLKLMGGYDNRVEEYSPTFVGAFINNKLVGVNSGHSTSESEYRSRGIYIFPKYRSLNISQKLFKSIEDQARIENKSILWSMPRASALPAYEKFGFRKVSKFFDDMEFGPNCYVVKELSDG